MKCSEHITKLLKSFISLNENWYNKNDSLIYKFARWPLIFNINVIIHQNCIYKIIYLLFLCLITSDERQAVVILFTKIKFMTNMSIVWYIKDETSLLWKYFYYHNRKNWYNYNICGCYSCTHLSTDLNLYTRVCLLLN